MIGQAPQKERGELDNPSVWQSMYLTYGLQTGVLSDCGNSTREQAHRCAFQSMCPVDADVLRHVMFGLVGRSCSLFFWLSVLLGIEIVK